MLGLINLSLISPLLYRLILGVLVALCVGGMAWPLVQGQKDVKADQAVDIQDVDLPNGTSVK